MTTRVIQIRVRNRLDATGKPYVIENVPGAPIRADLVLCGSMFGLRLVRHRWFEFAEPFLKLVNPCAHHPTPISVVGHGTPSWNRAKNGGKCYGIAEYPQTGRKLVSMANAKNDPPRYGDGSGLDDGPLLPGRPRRQKGHVVAEPEQVTEAQEDALGQDIDTLDNLAHALLLGMPAEFHVRQLKAALPELIEKMKNHFADAFGWDPWEFHPDHVRKAGG